MPERAMVNRELLERRRGREAGNGLWFCLTTHTDVETSLGDSRHDGNGHSDEGEPHTPMGGRWHHQYHMQSGCMRWQS